ncbi:hypothetical protein NQD34_009273 [Periophthalmus magnuspinnatus]|nr:hypothetical protein NQD34_009273 [Periophthalmus magnuspinnatus]
MCFQVSESGANIQTQSCESVKRTLTVKFIRQVYGATAQIMIMFHHKFNLNKCYRPVEYLEYTKYCLFHKVLKIKIRQMKCGFCTKLKYSECFEIFCIIMFF